MWMCSSIAHLLPLQLGLHKSKIEGNTFLLWQLHHPVHRLLSLSSCLELQKHIQKTFSSSPSNEQTLDYHRLEDGTTQSYQGSSGKTKFYSPPNAADSRPPTPPRSLSVYDRYRSHENDHSGLHSSSSFSQSEDFKKMLKSDKGSAALGDEKDEIYFVQQKYGYMSILFSLGQTMVLAIMMLQCGVAPFQINPMIGPYPDALSEWGGKNSFDILEDGEWWRLVTPIMLHAGIIHLLFNVAVQLETGAFFEREWGSAKWLIVYLASAVGSTALSVIFMPEYVSVGSSGSVMGLFGAKLAEVICRFCESDRTEQARIGHQVRKEQCAGVTCSVIVVMLFSFIPYGEFVSVKYAHQFFQSLSFCLKSHQYYALGSFNFSVDWAAHLGGLLGGFCVGMIVFSLDIIKQVWKLFWLLAGIALTVVFYSVTLQHMYSGEVEPAEGLKDVCGYYQQYFDDYECHCMREEHGGDRYLF